MIFTDDHPPPHVHVFGDGSAKIALGDAESGPTLISAEGMKAGDLRKAMRIVGEHRETLVERWSEFHG